MHLPDYSSHWPGEVVIVTQNVDSLHEAGGAAKRDPHAWNAGRGALRGLWPPLDVAPPEMAVGEPCPACAAPTARPDVVWFGEMPYHMDAIYDHLANAASIFTAIGTSGQVYPAAAFRARGHACPGQELSN